MLDIANEQDNQESQDPDLTESTSVAVEENSEDELQKAITVIEEAATMDKVT